MEANQVIFLIQSVGKINTIEAHRRTPDKISGCRSSTSSTFVLGTAKLRPRFLRVPTLARLSLTISTGRCSREQFLISLSMMMLDRIRWAPRRVTSMCLRCLGNDRLVQYTVMIWTTHNESLVYCTTPSIVVEEFRPSCNQHRDADCTFPEMSDLSYAIMDATSADHFDSKAVERGLRRTVEAMVGQHTYELTPVDSNKANVGSILGTTPNRHTID